jgi:predicted glycoside hydrolase/deacetylase ChbG (UPF0249 family)
VIQLVVVADDYGLTTATSETILRCHRHGVVTATSVLAVGPAFERTAAHLLDHGDLDVGLHLAAVGEDPPLLSAREIPTLVDDAGALPRDWRHLLRRLARGAIDLDDLRREWTAQHEALLGHGITIGHLNTHQHVHLWLRLGDLIAELATAWRIPYVRRPTAEPGRLAATAISPLSRQLGATLRRHGLASADATIGVAAAGHLDDAGLDRLLDRRARRHPAVVELVTHPGPDHDRERDRYRWGYRWGAESDLLQSPGLRRRLARAGYTPATTAAAR